MNLWRKFWRRISALAHQRELDDDMDEEMRSHIEMRTQKNIESGVKPEEARNAALRQFGSVDSVKETCREQRGVAWIENVVRDAQYGARILRKNPGFTI